MSIYTSTVCFLWSNFLFIYCMTNHLIRWETAFHRKYANKSSLALKKMADKSHMRRHKSPGCFFNIQHQTQLSAVNKNWAIIYDRFLPVPPLFSSSAISTSASLDILRNTFECELSAAVCLGVCCVPTAVTACDREPLSAAREIHNNNISSINRCKDRSWRDFFRHKMLIIGQIVGRSSKVVAHVGK